MSAAAKTTSEYFRSLFRERYSTSQLTAMNADEFKTELETLLQLSDANMEGFHSPEEQRDLSVRFHWGHNHDFGTFALDGRMGERHISIPGMFVDRLGALPLDLTGAEILDIGVWTGGTSLLLCALGANVLAIEEVKKYCDAVELLKRAFGIKFLQVERKSLYHLGENAYQDRFDYVLFSGVIYHVTDPVVALRIVFNALKDGGKCLVESYADDHEGPYARYEGPTVVRGGEKSQLNRTGWNWFVPSCSAMRQMMLDVGFRDVEVLSVEDSRVIAVGTRVQHVDMLRAGLSVPGIR